MVDKTTMRSFNAVDDGTIDWSKIRDNFTDLTDVIEDHYREIKALAQRQTFTISRLYQTRGRHTLLAPGKHLRCKPVSAYAVVHDNIEAEVSVSLVNYSHAAKFSNSEKKGSAKELELLQSRAVHFAEKVEVELSENRRVAVHVTFESIEVE